MNNCDHTQLNTAESALLALLGKSLFGVDTHLNEEQQLAAMEESRKQAVFLLAAESTALEGETETKICRQMFNAVRKNTDIHYQHRYLHLLMQKAGIPYVVLKGSASAYYYPNPQLRQMGDVDFLIAPENIERACEVLKQDGFVQWSERHICHIVFRKENMHFEMHFEAAGVPNGAAGQKVREYLQDAIISATTVQNELSEFQNPAPFHHGLVMLLHMQHHLLAEGIGLRHLCDWAVFVNHFTNEEFTALFADKLTACGLWDFAKAVSLAANIGMGLPYQDFMGENKELAKELLLDIIHGGNFGRKDKNRVNEGLFISNRGKDGVGHCRIRQMIFAVNQVVYTHWPISKKMKLLLPFGWMFFGIRRLCRVIRGVRKPLNLIQSYHGCQCRKEIYEQFHLFEIKN